MDCRIPSSFPCANQQASSLPCDKPIENKMEGDDKPALSGYYETLQQAIEDKLESGDFQLPILPVIASKLIGKLSHGNEDLEAIATLMQGDQTLAGHVLRFANSVLFGGQLPAETLQEAIARVGFSVIGELATVLTFGNNIFRAKGLEHLMDDIQEHAVLTAFIARDLDMAKGGDGDHQFLCGLLHTVGKPILLQLITTMGVMIPMQPPYEELKGIMDRLHHQAGKKASERWNLPSSVKASCAHYLAPETSKDHFDVVQCTGLASQLALIAQAEGSVESSQLQEVLSGMEESIIETFSEKIESSIQEAEALIEAMQR